MSIRLGVNIDHVATLRQQRRGFEPDPIKAALTAQDAGADGIVVHLREDARHIQLKDVVMLNEHVQMGLLRIPWSLEMAATDGMLKVARDWAQRVCLVPERRQELTTEGGLDVESQKGELAKYIVQLGANMKVSLFIDPDERQVRAAHEVGATSIELHTGAYAQAEVGPARDVQLERLRSAAVVAKKLKLELHAGHGLDYKNVTAIAAIPGIKELNIGFSIIGLALFDGLASAVRQMKNAIHN